MSSRLPLRSERAVITPANSGTKRLILQQDLEHQEFQELQHRAWADVFGTDSRKKGSIREFLFLASYYAGEERLKKAGLLEFFRKTQKLPDYRRAEDAIKRGWSKWVELEFGICADDNKNKLKIRQFVLLFELRGARSRDERQRILRGNRVECMASAAKGDDDFFRKLGRTLDDPGRTNYATHDFSQVLLHNWLTGFWWLMPLKPIAHEIARIQGEPDNVTLVEQFYNRLKKFTTRRSPGKKGSYFSADWNGCFYSTDPLLIGSLERDGSPLFSTAGRAMFGAPFRKK
jgi:hypothetical protein